MLEVSLHHIHAAKVSVREQAALVVDRLRRSGTMTFRALCGDSPDRLTTVARFLSLLELFREGAVAFEQVTPLGELTVRWTGPRTTTSRSPTSSTATDEFDGAAARGRRDARASGRAHEDEDDQPTSRDRRRGRRAEDERHARRARRRAAPGARGAADGRRPAARRRCALATAVGYPVDEVDGGAARRSAAEYAEQGRGFELRNVGRRLALLHPRGVRRGRRGASSSTASRPG